MSDANATVLCEEPSRFAGRGFDFGSCLHDHELHLIGSAPACLRVGSGASEETHTRITARHYAHLCDRTLALLNVPAIGIAYAGQEAASLPGDEHDRTLDMVLTEQGIRRFS